MLDFIQRTGSEQIALDDVIETSVISKLSN